MPFSTLRPRFLALSLLSGGAFVFATSCSERYADVVILDPEAAQNPGTNSTSGSPFDNGSQDFDGWQDPGLDDLCNPCTSSSECGGNNDFCLVWFGSSYCGMDCDRDSDCPDGYECTTLESAPDVEQCTPSAGSCDDSDAGDSAPPTDDGVLRDYVLDIMNDIRRENDLELFDRRGCLDDIADESLEVMEATGSTGSMFRSQCLNEIPMCDCNWQGEAQRWVPLEGRTWEEALHHPFEQADEPGNDFHEVYDPAWRSVGIAVDFDRDIVFISVEFSPG